MICTFEIFKRGYIVWLNSIDYNKLLFIGHVVELVLTSEFRKLPIDESDGGLINIAETENETSSAGSSPKKSAPITP